MKVTKQYLRKIIKEAIEEASGVVDIEVGTGGRGSGPDETSMVKSDVWSHGRGKHAYAAAHKVMKTASDPQVLMKKLYESLKRVLKNMGSNNSWGLYNLDVEKFVEGFLESSAFAAAHHGEAKLNKMLSSEKEKLNTLVSKAKEKTLVLFPHAKDSDPSKRKKPSYDGRGG